METPYGVKEVLVEKVCPGFIYRLEIINGAPYGSPDLEMKNCYAIESGHWIGDIELANQLCGVYGLRQLQKARESSSVCSIGFNQDEHKWYGWSHRAMCGFGLGDRVYEECYGDEHTPFVKHGSKQIIDMSMAKQAAINFAISVA